MQGELIETAGGECWCGFRVVVLAGTPHRHTVTVTTNMVAAHQVASALGGAPFATVEDCLIGVWPWDDEAKQSGNVKGGGVPT